MFSIVSMLVPSLVLFGCTNAYVLLQVRRQDANHSNVDALIHKVVSSEKLEKFAAKMGRKNILGTSTSTENENQSRSDEESRESQFSIEVLTNASREVVPSEQSTVPAPPPHNTPEEVEKKRRVEPNIDDLVGMAWKKIVKSNAGPMFRSKSEGYLFQPETVNLRSGKSTVYNVDSDSIVGAVREVLSSAALQAYLDRITRKTAFAYGAVETGVKEKVLSLFSKPENVKLRSGKSAVNNVDSGSILGTVRDVLSSASLQGYLDRITRKAASTYGAVETGVKKKVLNLLSSNLGSN